MFSNYEFNEQLTLTRVFDVNEALINEIAHALTDDGVEPEDVEWDTIQEFLRNRVRVDVRRNGTSSMYAEYNDRYETETESTRNQEWHDMSFRTPDSFSPARDMMNRMRDRVVDRMEGR